MTSKAAQDVKMGFWLAAGFWLFLVIISIILMLIINALKTG